MARYLLDSNAFLKAQFNPQSLREQARQAIEDHRNQLFVSAAGLWELAIKAANGKLPEYAVFIAAGAQGVRDALRESEFQILPVELEYSLTAASLPQHHRDPFDRLMIAQSLLDGLTIITSDRVFALYPGVNLLPS